MGAALKGWTIATMPLGGFMSRQWHDKHGGKFRAQVRRRAQRSGGATQSLDVRDADGFMVDYYTCDREYSELMNDPVDVDASERQVRTWREEPGARKVGNLW